MARDHDHLHLASPVELLERVQELIHQLWGHGVEHFWAVEAHQRDGSVELAGD
jgi:hypothetical protein